MKLIKNFAAAAVIAFSIASPTLALPRFPLPESSMTMNGEVQSPFPSIGSGHLINVVKIKPESGEIQAFPVDPNTNQGLKFDKGMQVKLDTTKMVVGKVVGLNRSGATVKLEGKDDPQSYYLSREQRRYVSVGDRVVITPYQRLVRADTVGLYPLYLWPVKK